MHRRNFLSTLAFFPFYIPPWEIDTVPYTANPDDATAPTGSVLAGTAAEEFRNLKKKINNLFLSSDYVLLEQKQSIKAGLYYVTSVPAGISTNIFYGYATDLTRNDISVPAGGVLGVAGQFNARIGPGLNPLGAKDVSVFGIATEAWTDEVGSQATLKNEVSIIAQANNNVMQLLGLDVVYKNRSDIRIGGSLPVAQGLGANLYNANSRGIQITAPPRSPAGEYCGFGTGIRFEANGLDIWWDKDAALFGLGVARYRRAIGLDFTRMGTPATTEPWTAWRHSSALAMAEYMSITWDSLQFTRTWLDSGITTMWFFGVGNQPTTIAHVGWDYTNGYMVYPVNAVAAGATAGAAVLPANPVGFKLEKIAGIVRKIPYYAI